jgi:TRAP transporter TAXI family solute receptor
MRPAADGGPGRSAGGRVGDMPGGFSSSGDPGARRGPLPRHDKLRGRSTRRHGMDFRDHDLDAQSRRDLRRALVTVAAVLVAVVAVSVHFLKPLPPRHLVFASGAEFGMYHRYAKRYREILARDGVIVEERMTNGANENLALLRDPKSGVDVALTQGGIATAADGDGIVMLATLYYEPLWLFHRASFPFTRVSDLAGKRIAVGAEGSGTRTLIEAILAANDVTGSNAELVGVAGTGALAALRAGELDVALFVGGANTPLIQDALRDPALRLAPIARAEAYARRFPYITKLTLPTGTIDLARNIPAQDVAMIGTKAMLVAREDLHPALVNLLVDAAREIHGGQGYFESAGEFPGTTQVDLPVSVEADRHRKFGPSLLHRYLPFWVATVVERTIILVVPLLVVLVPLMNILPQFLRYRVRSRIFRWYGELALLERDIRTRAAPLPLERWRGDLDRIEEAATQIRAPASYASEAYTLREHINIVRREVEARARGAAAGSAAAPVGADEPERYAEGTGLGGGPT